MLTTRVLMLFAAMLMLPAGKCAMTAPPTTAATETEGAICAEWQKSLPTRSHRDTEQTRHEIGLEYQVFLAVCGPLGFELPF